MKKKAQIYIGTSGWHYKHWIGTFYPDDTRDSQQLDHYLQFFQTVELNNSFYHLPSIETFSNWAKAVPAGFIFSVKASRYITHNKKLSDPDQSLALFIDHVKYLKKKLGPILFQLPPGWKVNADRLGSFLGSLPPGYRYAFEFRNSSWYTEEVYELLRKHRCAFCIYELAGHISPAVITANFVYVRLHGPGKNKYEGSYKQAALKKWAGQCIAWKKEGKDVFVYFDNDQQGYAAFNAKQLLDLLQREHKS